MRLTRRKRWLDCFVIIRICNTLYGVTHFVVVSRRSLLAVSDLQRSSTVRLTVHEATIVCGGTISSPDCENRCMSMLSNCHWTAAVASM